MGRFKSGEDKLIKLDTEDGRAKAEIYIKMLLLVLAGIWLFVAGTDLIDKNSKQLGTEAIPNANAKLEIDWNNIPEFDGDDRYCLFAGKYSITNVGKLTFEVRQVKFQLYRLQNVPRPSGDQLVSRYSLYPRLFPELANKSEETELHQAELIEESVEEIPVGVFLSPNNTASRTFGYVVKDERMPDYEDNRYSYAVVANASGGIPSKEGGWVGNFFDWLSYVVSGQYPTEFSEQDLQVVSALDWICQGSTVTQSDGTVQS